jgi:hypothetical protein
MIFQRQNSFLEMKTRLYHITQNNRNRSRQIRCGAGQRRPACGLTTSGWPEEIRQDLLRRVAVRLLCGFSRGWTGAQDPWDLKQPGRHVCRCVPQTPTGFRVRPQGVRWIAPKERRWGTASPAARSCDLWPTNGTAQLRVTQCFTCKGKRLGLLPSWSL